MKVWWIRGRENVSFNRPSTTFTLGVRGSGKSSLLEALGEQHLAKGHVVLDLFSAHDGESLAWLRSPFAKDKKILLLHGENVDVVAPVKTKKATEFSIRDFENYDIIISSSPLYSNMDDEFINAAQITDKMFRRHSWKRLVYGIVREASNLYYSRLKVSDNQIFAKAQMIYLLREGRHVGLALGLDSIRYYAIDIDIRNLADYMILKSQGIDGLSRDLNWLYSLINPAFIRRMSPSMFLILSRKGPVGLGQFNEITWHKQERENILKSVGVKVEYGTAVKAGLYKGTFKTVGDLEHSEIISLYIEGSSYNQIATEKERSTKTIHGHIHKHNNAVERSGFCARCRRMKSSYEAQKAVRG